MLQENILELVPQRPPFLMIDGVLASDDKKTVTSFIIKEDNILVKDGKFSEAGLIENIAQTAAARAGVTALRKNKPVAIGYIAAVQNLEIIALPEVNNTIHTEITADNEILNVLLISGTATCNGKLLAKCNMKIFIDQNKKPQT
ncbi:3-hydroxyacyl-ACP dehydratase [Panacibacter ginsenosidivorans]|uniref:3-hydroxyacyl-ACP dehydratase n=1 Tax=Panacibacter ginsenosidivorans TaxID=1813871 RepID=A0A5B8VFX6_9BACT|nr:3-hydroxyacyl-ACP dehydratase [Panacibacter ginsenosidivorans]QEC69466.1 3-hydroxyacyl-ACP dehydratase [Panacibacter ginsenosidivorans]